MKKSSPIPLVNISNNSYTENPSIYFNLNNVVKDKVFYYNLFGRFGYFFGTSKLIMEKQLRENFHFDPKSNIEYNKNTGVVRIYNIDKILNNNILIGETFLLLNYGVWKMRDIWTWAFQIYFIAYKDDYSNNYNYRIKVKKK
ncbi:hypothetical protein [Candidatus Phytoplasma bonamiae]|uniref:Uncharacterized protein n=1 Tax=Candidatus Phytoplasma bonamiae TaxID=2982626 RepID=A0ABT9D4H2_9MOLU|nr:hypothetical protein ['Bonamia sp.' little leaf phytoplasma]MDO8064309.1 hypothetical protein ['Bonamia sp.' little leaf phytoplasma]MDV3174809.1 hypothetical protein ['Bonamia sp.' little leaf phytoplasma]